MKRRTNFLIIMVIDCSDYVSSSLVLNTWGGGREPRLRSNASCLACRCKYLVQVRKPCRKMPALGLFLAEGDKEEEGEWRFRPGQLNDAMELFKINHSTIWGCFQICQWLANHNIVSVGVLAIYCKSLPFFYFLTFEKGRLLYIHPVGWSVGRLTSPLIFSIYRGIKALY